MKETLIKQLLNIEEELEITTDDIIKKKLKRKYNTIKRVLERMEK